MDFELSDDQQLLRETTRRFLEDTCSPVEVRRLAEDEPGGFDAGWWKQGAELGWTSMLVPEADGGGSVSGHGLLDAVVLAEELGRAVAPGPFLPGNVVAEAVARSGSDDQRRQVLPGLVEGSSVAAWCLAAKASGLDPGVDGTVTARPEGGGLVLDGTTVPVEGAGQADQLLVTAQGVDGPIQVLLPVGTPGVSVVGAHSMDLVRRFAQVRFDGVDVPPGALMGDPGTAADDVEHQLCTAVVLQCAELAGVVSRVLEFTVAYAFDRYSFGRPLASYQALKHRFADMRLWVEASCATSDAAARAVDAGAANASELVSVAKAYIAERAPALIQDCVQLHGGIGTTWDHDIHLYLRRAVVDRAQYGTPSDHRRRVATSMGLPGGDGA